MRVNAAPTRPAANKLFDARLVAAFTAAANDFLYQWDSSRAYNPAPGLERIRGSALAINSADAERNAAELGHVEREEPRVKDGRLLLIQASAET